MPNKHLLDNLHTCCSAKKTMFFVHKATEDSCTLVKDSQVVTPSTALSLAFKVVS